MKINKIFLSCIAAFCIGLAITTPFINNNDDIVVNAQNSSDYGAFSLNNQFTFTDLSSSGGSWYESSSSPSSINAFVGNDVPIYLEFPTSMDNLDYTNNFILTYYDYSNTFGTNYGFYVEDNGTYYNSFRIQMGTTSKQMYNVYLCKVADINNQNNYTDSLQIVSGVYGNVTYNYDKIYVTNGNALQLKYNISNNNTQPFLRDWYTYLRIDAGDYSFDFSKLFTSGSTIYGTRFDLIPYVEHFNINNDISISDDNFDLHFDLNTLSLSINNNYIYHNNNVTKGVSIDKTLFKGFVPLNELSFLYNIINCYYYYNTNFYSVTFNEYFKIPLNIYKYGTFSIDINSSYDFKTYDNQVITNISILLDSNTNDYIFAYKLNGFTDYIYIFNFNTNSFYDNYNENYLIIKTLKNNISFTQYNLSVLKHFEIANGYLERINGWYTFDLQPFNDTVEYNNINLNIGFTSNNESFNNLIILYDDIMNTKVATIYYRLLDDNSNVLKEYVVYEYSNIPYSSNWLSINYRQIYFDKKYISDTTYLYLDSIGAFTFISNNLNSDYTFNDLFWGIADVPFVTLSNLLGFEIFGVDLFVAFCSVLSVAIILWVIRKIL